MQAGKQKVVAATVHVALAQCVAHGVALLRAGAAQRVVATAGVCDDGGQRVAQIGVQHAAGGEIDLALPPQRALCVIAFTRIGSAVEQCVDGLIAFQIEQTHGLTGLYITEVGLARRNDMTERSGFGREGTVGQ
ncbi:hypothetical protein SDC9_59847 [bioreactor metagenome]|uniref:Uncharacterized protein n=1 Tax=bioreactor metagenome TaxID=1076179 RepID=A0A644XBA0_9ZZZZ